jgi:hypothetical protein
MWERARASPAGRESRHEREVRPLRLPFGSGRSRIQPRKVRDQIAELQAERRQIEGATEDRATIQRAIDGAIAYSGERLGFAFQLKPRNPMAAAAAEVGAALRRDRSE